jgi:hypothetical protein
MEGSTWGYDGRDIWVDRGCRGEFEVVTAAGEMAADAKEASCKKTAGKDKARELVQQCVKVSPGTKAVCNAENSCQLITDEIRRSCGLLGKDAPGFCGEYK